MILSQKIQKKFPIDSSFISGDNAIDFSLQNNSLILTTAGLRNEAELDLLSIFYDDHGSFRDDVCYNRIHLTFRSFLYKFKEFRFECCGANGYLGPTLELCKEYYIIAMIQHHLILGGIIMTI